MMMNRVMAFILKNKSPRFRCEVGGQFREALDVAKLGADEFFSVFADEHAAARHTHDVHGDGLGNVELLFFPINPHEVVSRRIEVGADTSPPAPCRTSAAGPPAAIARWSGLSTSNQSYATPGPS